MVLQVRDFTQYTLDKNDGDVKIREPTSYRFEILHDIQLTKMTNV